MNKLKILALIAIFSLASCEKNILTKYNPYEKAEDYKVLESNGAAFTNLKSINIDWISGDVRILSSTQYDYLSVIETTKEAYSDEFKAHFLYEGTSLDIKYCKSNISIPSSIVKTLEIYIPGNVSLDDITINNMSSSIYVENISCKNVNIENISGDVNLNSLVSSTINYSGVSGQLSASISNVTKNINIDQVSGSTILSFPTDVKGFLINYETVSGKINIDYAVKVNDNIYEYLEKDNLLIDFDSVSGDLLVSQRKK